MKDKVFIDQSNGGIMWRCPGCGHAHATDKRWTFNGDLKKPTFSPSYLATQDWRTVPVRCHCFINGGKIQYLSDCSHELAGKTIDMVDW